MNCTNANKCAPSALALATATSTTYQKANSQKAYRLFCSTHTARLVLAVLTVARLVVACKYNKTGHTANAIFP